MHVQRVTFRFSHLKMYNVLNTKYTCRGLRLGAVICTCSMTEYSSVTLCTCIEYSCTLYFSIHVQRVTLGARHMKMYNVHEYSIHVQRVTFRCGHLKMYNVHEYSIHVQRVTFRFSHLKMYNVHEYSIHVQRVTFRFSHHENVQ